MNKTSSIHVQIVLFDGFDLLDALAPYEVFMAAADFTDGALRVEFVSAEGPRSVPSGLGGLTIPASGYPSSSRADVIVLPGAAGKTQGDGPDSIPVLLHRAATSELAVCMREAVGSANCIVGSVCGGSLVLAIAGLIQGRHAITHHLGVGLLDASGVATVHARVVDDGNLVTAGGVTSGLDLALYLVERMLGSRVANKVERLFEYERRGTVWKNDGRPDDGAASKDSLDVDNTPMAALKGGRPKIDNFVGQWDVNIATPLGSIKVLLDIRLRDGALSGVAIQSGDESEFDEIILEDSRMYWTQNVTKPMKLRLRFCISVDGNELVGSAKAGVLPASKVRGTRRVGVSQTENHGKDR